MEVLVIEYWNLRPARSCLVWQAGLFVIWCLEFVILDRHGPSKIPRYAGKDQVFNNIGVVASPYILN
jgi:hypothetical protein